jgi:diacylglycerol kinase family enzyme
VAASTAIFLNPRAGTAPEQGSIERALHGVGLRADIHPIPAAARVADWVSDVARRYDTLVAAGGDGTVSTIADAAVRLEKSLGVIPTGTLNHFARDLHIPLELDKAVGVLAAGHIRPLDVGFVNNSIFVNNASIGNYPRLVWERSRARATGLPARAARTLALLRTFLNLRMVTVHASADGVELIRRSPFVFIGNSRYEMEGTAIGRRPVMTDGRLWLYVTPESGRLDVLSLAASAILRKLEEHEKFESFQASSISLETSRRRVAIALDGEIKVLASPLQFRIRNNALRAIVPPPAEGR